jgi:hypothetical protein
MNDNTRIQLTDSTPTILSKLSDGNIGALSVLIEIIKHNREIDPDAFGGMEGSGVMTLLSFDSFAIYGEDIWVLFKDICGQDYINLLGVLRAIQLGIISEDGVTADIKARKIGDRSKSINVAKLLAKVRKRLPAFGQVEA